MRIKLAYPVELTPRTYSEGMRKELVVHIADWTEIIESGPTETVALDNARKAIERALRSSMQRREDVPLPSLPSHTDGWQTVVPSPLLAAKVLIYMAMRRAGVSQAELARKMGVGDAEIVRLLDPDSRTKFATIDAAMEALGLRLVLETEGV